MHLSPEGLVIDSATAAPRGRPFHTCNTHWMLTDFTEANGATRCVPGTHLCGAYPHSIMNEDTRRERFPSEQVITGQVSNHRVSDPLSFEQLASSATPLCGTGRQRHRLERPHLALGHAQHLAGRATLVPDQLLRHARVGRSSGAEVSGRRGSAGGRGGDAGERLPGAAGGRAPPLLRAVAAAKAVAKKTSTIITASALRRAGASSGVLLLTSTWRRQCRGRSRASTGPLQRGAPASPRA